MTIKLSHAQFVNVHNMLSDVLDTYQPANIAEKLLHEIVDGINEKMRKRIKKMQFGNKAGTTLKLTSIEAKAFYTWYMQLSVEVPANYVYECVAIDSQIINPIDKEYA